MHIGKRIAKLRRLCQYSQHGLGKGILSASYLSNLEAGKSMPSGKILRSLAERLDVPADYLLNWDRPDEQLEKRLTEYRESLIGNLDLAKRTRTHIKKEHPFIQSIDQEVYFYLCECHFLIKTNELEKALEFYKKEVEPYLDGLDIDEALPDKIKEVYYNLLGLRSFYQLHYAESLVHYRKQLSYIDGEFLKAVILYNISLLSLHLDHIQKGIDYGREALDLYLKQNKWLGIVKTYNLLGILNYEDHHFTSAKDCLSKALEIANVYEFTSWKERIYHNFGMIYKKTGEWQDSENYYSQSLALKKASQSPDIGITYRGLVDVYLHREKYDRAEELLKEALRVCPSEKHFHQLKMSEGRLYFHYGNTDVYEKSTGEAIQFLYEHQQWKSLTNMITPFADYLFENERYQEAARFYKMEIEARERLRSEEA